MSTTAISTDVAAAIASTRAIYQEVDALNKRWLDLKAADDARLAYKAALAAEDKELEALERDKTALDTERRRRRIVGKTDERRPPPPPSALTRVNRAPTSARTETSAAERPAPPPTADRRRLKKTLNRFQFTWEINPAVVAQINSIADNAERPIGEALALLDPRVFELSIPGESDIDRVARLGEWKGALDGYADHLRAEIQKLENQYASVLGIWDLWRKARVDAVGQDNWNQFIDKTRAEKRHRIDVMSATVRDLREELGL
jgi:hypothetical protein